MQNEKSYSTYWYKLIYIYNSPVGAAIAALASQLQCPLANINIFGHSLAKINIFRRRNCSARKYLNFIKIEIFAQNYFNFFKTKKAKNLPYQKKQNLVCMDFFSTYLILKNKFVFFSNFATSQLQCQLILAGTAIAAPASQLRRRPDCIMYVIV